jgi:hypothetical protein
MHWKRQPIRRQGRCSGIGEQIFTTGREQAWRDNLAKFLVFAGSPDSVLSRWRAQTQGGNVGVPLWEFGLWPTLPLF